MTPTSSCASSRGEPAIRSPKSSEDTLSPLRKLPGSCSMPWPPSHRRMLTYISLTGSNGSAGGVPAGASDSGHHILDWPLKGRKDRQARASEGIFSVPPGRSGPHHDYQFGRGGCLLSHG